MTRFCGKVVEKVCSACGKSISRMGYLGPANGGWEGGVGYTMEGGGLFPERRVVGGGERWGNGWFRPGYGQTLIACGLPDPLEHEGLGGGLGGLSGEVIRGLWSGRPLLGSPQACWEPRRPLFAVIMAIPGPLGGPLLISQTLYPWG